MLRVACKCLNRTWAPPVSSMLSRKFGPAQQLVPRLRPVGLSHQPRQIHSLCHQQFAAGCSPDSRGSHLAAWSASSVHFSSRSRGSHHQHWLPNSVWPVRGVHPWPSKDDDQDLMKRYRGELSMAFHTLAACLHAISRLVFWGGCIDH